MFPNIKSFVFVNICNFCKFALLVPPSTIEMLRRITFVKETKMHHLETLTGLIKDSLLQVSKIMYKSRIEVFVSLTYQILILKLKLKKISSLFNAIF